MENQKEVWKSISEYENLYSVSNLGRVKSHKRKVRNRHGFRFCREKILSNTNNGVGYLICGLSKKGKRKNFLIHRLVCYSFLDSDLNKTIVNHKNGIKTDNRVENLEWCTQMENIKHSIDNNLVDQLGSKHHSSKVNESDVLKIRSIYIKHYFGYKKISEMYNISWVNVRNIIKRRTWRHI